MIPVLLVAALLALAELYRRAVLGAVDPIHAGATEAYATELASIRAALSAAKEV